LIIVDASLTSTVTKWKGTY